MAGSAFAAFIPFLKEAANEAPLCGVGRQAGRAVETGVSPQSLLSLSFLDWEMGVTLTRGCLTLSGIHGHRPLLLALIRAPGPHTLCHRLPGLQPGLAGGAPQTEAEQRGAVGPPCPAAVGLVRFRLPLPLGSAW